jgi:hypothetical protein
LDLYIGSGKYAAFEQEQKTGGKRMKFINIKI